jgi:hypothetical protein
MNYSFPVELALWVGVQVCGGLDHAHTQTDPAGVPLQVVHRDVSPSNVMVTYDGELKLIDFGAALSTLKEELTAPRVVIGNLSYMAPEHARKQHVDLRADLFSVGVVLWELLTWQLIPADGDPIERWRRAARPNFQKPSHFRSDLPPELDRVVMRALAVDPRDRYPTAEAFRAELITVLDRHWPDTDSKRLGAFMRATFAAERDAERAVVAEALGLGAAVAVTGTLTDPFSQVSAPTRQASDPFAQAEAAPRSDPMPALLPLETTLPHAPALGMGREVTDPAARATLPNRPALGLDGSTGENTLPPTRSPLAVSDPARTVLARSDPSARPMQRTPTQMRRPLPPYVWAAVGVGLGFGLVALVVAFSR